MDDKLDYEEVQIKMLSSNVILDIPFNGQSGFTHRVIEALANGQKLITTNSNIKKEKITEPDQVQILDINQPILDSVWIKEKVVFPIDDYFNSFELSEWLKAVMVLPDV